MFRTFLKADHRKGPSFVLKGDFFSSSSGPEEVGRPPGLALVLAARTTSAAWKKSGIVLSLVARDGKQL